MRRCGSVTSRRVPHRGRPDGCVFDPLAARQSRIDAIDSVIKEYGEYLKDRTEFHLGCAPARARLPQPQQRKSPGVPSDEPTQLRRSGRARLSVGVRPAWGHPDSLARCPPASKVPLQPRLRLWSSRGPPKVQHQQPRRPFHREQLRRPLAPVRDRCADPGGRKEGFRASR